MNKTEIKNLVGDTISYAVIYKDKTIAPSISWGTITESSINGDFVFLKTDNDKKLCVRTDELERNNGSEVIVEWEFYCLANTDKQGMGYIEIYRRNAKKPCYDPVFVDKVLSGEIKLKNNNKRKN